MTAPPRSAAFPSVAQRLDELARDRPRATALSARAADGAWHSLRYPELRDRVASLGGRLTTHPHHRTLIEQPNGVAFVVAVLATWWAGKASLVIPVGTSGMERKTLLSGVPDGAEPLVVAEDLAPAGAVATPDPPRRHTPEAWFLPSGGTTGYPRLVPVTGDPSALLAGQEMLLRQLGWRPDWVQLVMGPLTHAAPFTCALTGILGGNHVVVLHRFEFPALADAVRRHPPQWCQATPHQLALISANDQLATAFTVRLEGLMHTAAPCPPEVKRAWIDRVGADRLYELYGSTQMVGTVINRGDEWLDRPGTAGKPFMTQIRIVDSGGLTLPCGQVGEVFMRTSRTSRLPRSATAHLKAGPDGFFSVGDLGYLDEHGYLYLTSRADDVLIVGGANVSAREVEDALLGHPRVAEAVVVGRPHRLLGEVPHAIVVARDAADRLDVGDLRAHCAGLLAAHKVPVSIEQVAALHRSSAGKVERFRYRYATDG
jgi:bile acid-coenzyme A ligase